MQLTIKDDTVDVHADGLRCMIFQVPEGFIITLLQKLKYDKWLIISHVHGFLFVQRDLTRIPELQMGDVVRVHRAKVCVWFSSHCTMHFLGGRLAVNPYVLFFGLFLFIFLGTVDGTLWKPPSITKRRQWVYICCIGTRPDYQFHSYTAYARRPQAHVYRKWCRGLHITEETRTGMKGLMCMYSLNANACGI